MRKTPQTYGLRLALVGCLVFLIALTGIGLADPPDLSPAVLSGLAAESTAPVRYTLDESAGTVTWLEGSFTPAVPDNPVESAYAFLETHRAAFRIANPRQEFSVLMSNKGLLTDSRHVYLEQRIQGLPVWGRRLGFHYDPQGRLYAVNGKYGLAPASGLPTQPLLSSSQALDRALTDLRANPFNGPVGARSAPAGAAIRLNARVPVVTELIYYPDQAGQLRLCYRVEFSVLIPPGDWLYFVDAAGGGVLFKYNNIQTAGPAVGSGLDLFNTVATLNTYQDTDGQYKLIDTSKAMYTQHSTHPYTTWQGCIEVRDCKHELENGAERAYEFNPVVADPNGDNVFTHGGSDPKTNYQPAVQLSVFLSRVYDFYQTSWSRNSVDNQGFSLIGNIHCGVKWDNSMWTPSGKMMFFGDGSDSYWPESRSLDTVTHEATHGLTQFAVPSNGYIYVTESGAINESHSDIAAATHDYSNWNYGEDYHLDGKPSRRFDDPTAVDNPQPKDMYDFYLMPLQIDNGGVHYNSGIGNHFFYQLAMGLPAESPATDGRFTASQITYRSYVYGAANPMASFREWGQYLKQSAVDLYGPGAIYNQVVAALNYVHIPQARIGYHDNWQLKLDNDGQPYFFTMTAFAAYSFSWPVVSTRFTRPTATAKLKTVSVGFKDTGVPCTYSIWYTGANADGSPDESVTQRLYSAFASTSIRSGYVFNNFKLDNPISVASNFHIAVELTSGSYGYLLHDTGDPATERSWYKYIWYDWTYGTYFYSWRKVKQLYSEQLGITFDPVLMIRVIYEDTPQTAPAAPILAEPADGASINNPQVTFSWSSVSGADRYFLEVNSSADWSPATRVYFAGVSGTSQSAAGFPVGANYWRVYAGNADAWSGASSTRSFTELAAPPTLACSASNISARVTRGRNAPAQSFSVWNSGSGTLSYSITKNASWLAVAPSNGTSSGEQDTIQVAYNTSSLDVGVYTAAITVAASDAAGSPVTIPVTLTVGSVLFGAGDIDGDGRADPVAVDSSGNWYIWFSASGYNCTGPYALGNAGGTPLAADFDGDRKADPAVVDCSGNWLIWMSGGGYVPAGPYALSSSGTAPVAADFDGDRRADPAAVDGSGNWIVRMSGGSYAAAGPYPLSNGGTTPLAADFDGDQRADPAGVDASGNWIIRMSSGSYAAAGPYNLYAGSGTTPVAADFDGDGQGDPAVVDRSGNWIIWMSSGGYAPQGPYALGTP